MIPEKDIARLARQICINLDLDPDEAISGCSPVDTDTPAERASRSGRIQMTSMTTSRWRLYRGMAAEALAVAKALEIMKTEKANEL